MSREIKRWYARLERRGFSHTIDPAHWGEKWKERKWVAVDTGHSILEIIQASEYIRIVAGEEDETGKKFFTFLRYISTEHPMLPKTDWYMGNKAVECLSRSQVWRRIIRQL